MSDIQEQISILVEVQAVDEEILQADRQLAAMDDEAVSLDQEVAARESLVKGEKKALEDLKKSYRDLETEFKLNADLINKSNAKLRSVKTNKEYQSVLKAVEDIQKKNSNLEDRMIAFLDEIERAEAAVSEIETQLAAFTQSCRDKKETIAANVRRERQAVETLNQKKVQISAKADPRIISILDDVKKKVRGMAVVPVQQAVCMGCHMNIPPQLFNELQRFDELRFCPHCHRIIYWKAKENE